MPHQHPDLRDPATLFFQRDSVRRWIIATYWLVIISALPLWWWTTSIERLSLPSAQVSLQTQRRLHIPIDICIEDAFNVDSTLQTIGNGKWDGLDVQIHGSQPESHSCTYRVVVHDKVAVMDGRTLGIPLQDRERIGDILASLVGSSSACLEDLRVIQYSPRYRLSFSILNEDSSAGDFYANWDISQGLKRHIYPIMRSLSTLHNFTIESQVQMHAPLAFSPVPSSDETSWGISREDLSVFVNSAEWTLSSSSSNDPVLHFLLFVPSAIRRPLYILDHTGLGFSSGSFLLPQWGSIMIHNPQETLPPGTTLSSDTLDSVFSSFATHLLTLLGTPAPPFGVEAITSSTAGLNDWQLDALLRCRALSNSKGTAQTLQSILSLVDQIPNMPVDETVRGDIQDSLSSLEQMHETSQKSLNETLEHSARALALASRAFFNPGMLALLYFPAEHKYAVYTPMFASAFIPPFVAVLREFSAWRRQRRQPEVTTAQ